MLLLVVMVCMAGVAFPLYSSEPEEHHGQGEPHNNLHSEFVKLLGLTLEDGFFGGVKWGIAAAFYHAFYNILALGLQVIPRCAHETIRTYAYIVDTLRGLPPALDIHELTVLVALIEDAFKEYEAHGVSPSENVECAQLVTRTLTAVVQHIHEYATMRIPRYTSAYYDKEIVFFLTLIAATTHDILNCIACVEHHKEVVSTSKTAIILMQKLIFLLQGPAVDENSYDPSMAWFSGQRTLYAWHF